MGTKICTKCGVKKSLDEFNNRKDSKDGKRLVCKECMKQYNKQYRQENKEYLNEYSKQKHQENKEHQNEYYRQYHQENKKYCNKCSKKYYQNHKEEICEGSKKYRENNKEHYIEYFKNYRQTDKGKEVAKKSRNKRKREFGYILLNNMFENCCGHHIDNDFVINIPSQMHINNSHSQKRSESMILINKLAFEYLYNHSESINEENLKLYNKLNGEK